MTQRIACANGAHRERAVVAAVAAVRRGDLVLVPTEHVYALATDAFSARGVESMRRAKGYDGDAPLPVMVGSRSTVPGIAARVTPAATRLMEAFWPGPLTLLLDPQPSLAWHLPLTSPVAIRVPAHPLALALLARTGPLVVTAANLPGMTPPGDLDDAVLQLGDFVALALDAGPLDARPLEAGADGAAASTVVDATVDPPVVVREGAIAREAIRRVGEWA